MKEWQKGFQMEMLSALAKVFKSEYQPYIFGAFGLPKERDIATALEKKAVIYTKEADTALIFQHYKQSATYTDFTGAKRTVPAGAVMVKDFAGIQKEKVFSALETLKRNLPSEGELWAECFQENAEMKSFYERRGFGLQGVKISAASELIGVYAKKDSRIFYSAPDKIGIRVIKLDCMSPLTQAEIKAEFKDFGAFAQHYSSYNKRGSWQAVALQGFDADDPFFIIKPSEMSKKWKAENSARLFATARRTTAALKFRSAYSFAQRFLDRYETSAERIRLMWLGKETGELTRHADITDRDAGTADGKILRLHFPIITHKLVQFSSWDLNGDEQQIFMPERSVCYLDTRKPHKARNASPIDRLHLVVDAFSNKALRRFLCS